MNYFLHAFKHIFTYSGRARRAEYGWFTLINALLHLGVVLIFFVLMGGTMLFSNNDMMNGTAITSMSIIGVILYIAFSIYSILTFFVILSLTARRLHDLGRSGWWQLFFYIGPLILLAIIFVLLGLFKDSQFLSAEIASIAMVILFTLATFAFLLVLLFKDGQKHTNKYGESPKYPTQPETQAISH